MKTAYRFVLFGFVFSGVVGWMLGQGTTPEPVWKGSAGAGIALTGGNSDTATYNLTLDLTRDPKTRNIMKFSGVYLRGDQADVTTIDRLRLAFRDEYKLDDRTFLFGDLGYLRDPFKAIDYLLNPVGGIGYKLVATDRLALSANGGLGVVWEKNPEIDVATSGTVNAGQDLAFKLSETAAITEVFTALWKMDDFEDALYHFGIGLSTTLTPRSELKLDFINDYKNVTPSPDIKKNDYAFIASILFKF